MNALIYICPGCILERTKQYKMADYFTPPLSMSDYMSRTSCHNEEELYLDKLQKIFGGYPHFGVPHEPSKICPGIYVGTTADGENLSLLRRIGINYVLFCSTKRKPLYNRQKRSNELPSMGVKGYLHIEADDHCDYDVDTHFITSFNWIWRARKTGGQVLICSDGPSLSSSIAVGYLLDRGMHLLEAAQIVKDLRRTAVCNVAFMRQLVQYAKEKGVLDRNPENCKATRYGTGQDRYRLVSVNLPDVQIVRDKATHRNRLMKQLD